MLLLKGRSLLVEAGALRPEHYGAWLAIGAGIVAGLVKARFVFIRSCRKNLARIDALGAPKVWDFYSPKFFLALALMISAGATLSRLAHGSYPWLIGVGALDIALSTALLSSSFVFWNHQES